jgi:hypothetical protein
MMEMIELKNQNVAFMALFTDMRARIERLERRPYSSTIGHPTGTRPGHSASLDSLLTFNNEQQYVNEQ